MKLTLHEIEEYRRRAERGAALRVLISDWPPSFRKGVELVRSERDGPPVYIPTVDTGTCFHPPIDIPRLRRTSQDWEPWELGHKITLDNCRSGCIVVL